MREAIRSIACLIVVTLTIGSTATAQASPSPDSPVLRFGRGAAVIVPPSPALALSGALSVEFWVYQTALPHYEGTLVDQLGAGPDDPFAYSIHTVAEAGVGRLSAGYYPGGNSCCPFLANLPSKPGLPLREWVHLAFVLDASGAHLYANGQLLDSSVNGPPVALTSLGPLEIGRGLFGTILDLRIWSRALSASEVAQHAGGAAVSGPDLVAHFPLDEGSGQQVFDQGPHELVGTLGIDTKKVSGEPRWLAPGLLETGPYFERVAFPIHSRGGAYPPMNGDAIAIDANGDGLDDLIFFDGTLDLAKYKCEYPYYQGTPPRPPAAAFRNLGNGEFVLDLSLVEIDVDYYSNGVRHAVGDLDGDGRRDLVVFDTGPEYSFPTVDCGVPGFDEEADIPGGRDRVFLGRSGGGLREATATHWPPRTAFDHDGALGDVDGDGDLDLWVGGLAGTLRHSDCTAGGNLSPGSPCPTIAINDGQGHFSEAFNRLPVDVTTLDKSFYTAGAFGDFDADGDQDLVVGGAWPTAEPYDVVLRNDGKGKFTKALPPPIPNRPIASNREVLDFVIEDFDRDGRLDVLANYSTIFDQATHTWKGPGLVALYLNRGNGTFRDATKGVPQTEYDTTESGVLPWFVRCEPADLNADGAPDFACSWGSRAELFYNRGDATFERMPAVDDFGGEKILVADINGDGAFDFYGAQSGGAPAGGENVAMAHLQRKPWKPVVPLPPGPPSGEWIQGPGTPGFLFKVRIGGDRIGQKVDDCIAETVCVSGAVPGRSEVFLRVVGPKPNGRLWPTLVKFSTATVEVWVKQLATERALYYVLPGSGGVGESLPGLFDRNGFADLSANRAAQQASQTDHPLGRPRAAREVGEADPPPPAGNWLSTSAIPGFEAKVRVSGDRTGAKEADCIEETLCVSGAVAGRPEVFVRVVGPKPNGFLWPTLVKFNTTQAEIWLRQVKTGKTNYYLLEGARPGFDELQGLFDREGFVP